MPDLSFRIGEITAMRYAAVPTISTRLYITNAVKEEQIQSISLNCQVQLQPLGRAYSAAEEARLLDLFGEREQWSRTLKPLHWMNVVVRVLPFRCEVAVDLPLPCSLDFDVAANKYFYGLEAGSISVAVFFSGTTFYADEHGLLQVAQIPWDRDARFKLPVEVWKQAIGAHFPDSAWVRVPHETFERLYQYKVAHGIPSWEQAVDRLLEVAERRSNADEVTASAGESR